MIFPHSRPDGCRASRPSPQAECAWALYIALQLTYTISQSTIGLLTIDTTLETRVDRGMNSTGLALSFCCLQRWHALGTLFFLGGPSGGDPNPGPNPGSGLELTTSGGCESVVDGAMFLQSRGQMSEDKWKRKWTCQKNAWATNTESAPSEAKGPEGTRTSRGVFRRS